MIEWLSQCLDRLDEESRDLKSLERLVVDAEGTAEGAARVCCRQACLAGEGCWQWLNLLELLSFASQGAVGVVARSSLLDTLCPALAWADPLLVQAALSLFQVLALSSELARMKLSRNWKRVERAVQKQALPSLEDALDRVGRLL